MSVKCQMYVIVLGVFCVLCCTYEGCQVSGIWDTAPGVLCCTYDNDVCQVSGVCYCPSCPLLYISCLSSVRYVLCPRCPLCPLLCVWCLSGVCCYVPCWTSLTRCWLPVLFVSAWLKVAPEHKEFSLGVATLGDTIGIALAGAVAIPSHNHLCRQHIRMWWWWWR